MSSRVEEKERRKAERLAAQKAAEEAAARRRRTQMAGGALVALAIVVAVVIAVAGGGGGGAAALNASSSVSADIKGITLPAPKITDLHAAATAAGCALHTYPIEGRTHVLTAVTYRTNPPTSGNHNPTPAADGVYDPSNTPAKENFVHTLEHGRIEYQYRPGTPIAEIKQLEALWNESVMGMPGYKQLLFQNTTNMPFAIAATAWGQLIGCPSFNPRIFDALRDFRNAYLDKGPEQLPPD